MSLLFTWQCKSCSLINPFKNSECEACGRDRFGRSLTDDNPKQSRPLELPSPQTTKQSKLKEDDIPTTIGKWNCKFCTLKNSDILNECEACGARKVEQKFEEKNSVSGNNVELVEDPSQEEEVECELCGCVFGTRDSKALEEHSMLHLLDENPEAETDNHNISIESIDVHHGDEDVIFIEEEPKGQFKPTRRRNSNSKSDNSFSPFSQFPQDIEVLKSKFSSTAFYRQYRRILVSENEHWTAKEVEEKMESLKQKVFSKADLETAHTQFASSLCNHYLLFGAMSSESSQLSETLNRFFGTGSSCSDWIVSESTIHFASGRGDAGWGCGYRNIQMCGSALMEIPAFRNYLFSGRCFIPSIPLLQLDLDHALKTCKFDPASRTPFLYGKNRWLSSFDVVALFRSYRLNAQITTFTADPRSKNHISDNPSNGSRTHGSEEIDLVHSNSFNFQSVRHQPSFIKNHHAHYVPHKAMFEWIWNYFEQSRASGASKSVLPLFLQHQGHSRTIVGAEKTNKSISLLLFDPSFEPGVMPHLLETQKTLPKSIRKSLSDFKHKDYQIIHFPLPHMIIQEDKIEESKKIIPLPTVRSRN